MDFNLGVGHTVVITPDHEIVQARRAMDEAEKILDRFLGIRSEAQSRCFDSTRVHGTWSEVVPKSKGLPFNFSMPPRRGWTMYIGPAV